MNAKEVKDFSNLTPDVILAAVEETTGSPMTGLIYPMQSYINRVYELQTRDGDRVIAKFYRNGRWSDTALMDEHKFILDCAAAEIPVAAPIPFSDGKTLGRAAGHRFAIFPKKSGREFEANFEEDWIRIGHLIARMHSAGSRRGADSRVKLHPNASMAADIAYLKESGAVTVKWLPDFEAVAEQLLATAVNRFEDTEMIRIHGDCHRANLLERPGEGLMLIDFDDMAVGPPVQDIWLLLPDHVRNCRREIDLMLSGYEQFRDFDHSTLGMIETLRAMRIIYYLAWCARQRNDFQFRKHYPDWGNDGFWGREIADLKRQLQIIQDHDQEMNGRGIWH